MALNASVTGRRRDRARPVGPGGGRRDRARGGHEPGAAQAHRRAVQPGGGAGPAHGVQSAAEYHRSKRALLPVVLDALADLRRRFDVVICEGAGSPAEINLLDPDIVNLPWPGPPGCRPSWWATSTGAVCSPRSTAPSRCCPTTCGRWSGVHRQQAAGRPVPAGRRLRRPRAPLRRAHAGRAAPRRRRRHRQRGLPRPRRVADTGGTVPAHPSPGGAVLPAPAGSACPPRWTCSTWRRCGGRGCRTPATSTRCGWSRRCGALGALGRRAGPARPGGASRVEGHPGRPGVVPPNGLAAAVESSARAWWPCAPACRCWATASTTPTGSRARPGATGASACCRSGPTSGATRCSTGRPARRSTARSRPRGSRCAATASTTAG